jgi:hypothetical protein
MSWVEPAATLLIAVAAILTAWAAFQSTKWNGVQADNSRQAAAAGTAASRETTIASTQRNVDVGTFLQWLQAARNDIADGLIDPGGGPYVPDTHTLSGFVAVRFRPEFRAAFDAWIATRPFVNSEAPATPFQLSEYSLAADAEMDRLINQAETSARMAGVASDRAENYVLLTVLFAIALVFASIGSKLSRVTTSGFLVGLALFTVLLAAFVMATFPIEV